MEKEENREMNYETIIHETDEAMAIITLNRPDKLNALDPKMLQEMVKAINDARDHDEVKVLIITGAGRAFCSGMDLTAPVRGTDPKQSGITRPTRLEPFVSFGRLVKCLHNFHKPAIAAINGFAVGAGLSVACLCDMRIASENASLGAIFVKRGLVADTGLTYLLPRMLGTEKALEIMWTGDMINAREAERISLVGKVVPHGDLMATAKALASRIAAGPSTAVELMKRMVYEGMEANSFPLQLAYEAWAQEMCYRTDDYDEGIKAFQERRSPTFMGT